MRYDEALTLLREHLALHPSDIDVRLLQPRALRGAGRDHDALEPLRQAVELAGVRLVRLPTTTLGQADAGEPPIELEDAKLIIEYNSTDDDADFCVGGYGVMETRPGETDDGDD